MPSTVKVPLLGNVPKGGVIAGALAAVGVGGYVWWRHMKGQQTDATGGAYGYGAEGYGYGSEFYGQFGTDQVTPFPMGSEYGYGAFGYGMYNPYTGQYLGPPQPGQSGATSPAAPTTNLQWVQMAQQGLHVKGSRTALLLYVGGLPLTHGQARTVQEAIGLMGNPPVSGPNGYPPKWHAAPVPGQNGHHVHTITANGHQTLWQIAHANHDSEAKVVRLNPRLSHYVGSKKNVKKGTRVKV